MQRWQFLIHCKMMTTVIITMMEIMMLIMGTNRTQKWVFVGRSSDDDNQDADGDGYDDQDGRHDDAGDDGGGGDCDQ